MRHYGDLARNRFLGKGCPLQWAAMCELRDGPTQTQPCILEPSRTLGGALELAKLYPQYRHLIALVEVAAMIQKHVPRLLIATCTTTHTWIMLALSWFVRLLTSLVPGQSLSIRRSRVAKVIELALGIVFKAIRPCTPFTVILAVGQQRSTLIPVSKSDLVNGVGLVVLR
jgi:hypothetical protein